MEIAKRGLRKIVVEGQTFFWKFTEKIFVFPEDDKNSLLILDFGWFDVWDYVNDQENRPPNFEPRTVSSGFVAQSIRYGISKGWPSGQVEVDFKDEAYTLKEKGLHK